ncbi:MAG: hypothetical protein Q4F79_05130 [Eubacteriales bacterium]|nr:hypothetical protein [Eubacteriales bacterium]
MVQLNVQKTNIAVALLGFITSIILISEDCPSYYVLLPLIPFVYGGLNLVCGVVWKKAAVASIFGIMFNGMMFLRAVVMPLLLMLGDYETVLRVNIDSNMPKAILLFSYEMICEYLLYEYIYKDIRDEFYDKYSVDVSNEYRYGFMVVFLIAGLIGCLILAPSAVTFYRTIFGITDYEYTGFDSHSVFTQYATSLIAKFGLVTFRYFAGVCRLVFPALILYRMKKRNANRIVAFVVTIILIFVFDLLLVDDTIATSIVNALITLVYYNRLFSSPKQLNRYFVYAALGVASYFELRLSLTASMSHYTNMFTRISNITQAYFLGTRNIAAGFNLYADSIFGAMKYMIYELLRGIPYASTIFGLDNTSVSTLFNSVNNCTGQIVPVISSGNLYFSFLFAPLYPMLFLLISYKNSVKVDVIEKPLSVLGSITICVYTLMGISMYSAEATWAFTITVGLAIKLLSFLFERKSS